MDNGKKSNAQNDLSTNQVQLSTIGENANQKSSNIRNVDEMKKVVLHQILKKLMKERRTTVRKLAKECSLPVSTLGSYLSGKKANYSAEHLEALSTYFSCSIDYLLFGKVNPPDIKNLPSELIYQGLLMVRIERPLMLDAKPKDDNEKGE